MPVHLLQWHRSKKRLSATGQLYGAHMTLASLNFQLDDTANTVLMLAPVCRICTDRIEWFQPEFLDYVGRKRQLGGSGIHQRFALDFFPSLSLGKVLIQ